MITSKEESFILKHMTEFYHVPKQNSHLFGEPFFENGYLYYFDGRAITFITERLGKETDKASLNKTIKSIASKHNPTSLLVWGETTTKEISLKGYKVEKSDILIWKTEMRFWTKDFSPNKKFRWFLNLAKRNNLKMKFVKSPYYKNEYMKLIANSHPNMIGLKNASYYCVYPLVPQTRFVEFTMDNKIVAVQIMTEAMPQYVNLSEFGWDKSIDRLSGMTAAMLIDYYKDKSKIISFGGCSTENIFKHKKEIIGDIPYYRYKNLIWYNFYKKKQHQWWIGRMMKK